MHAISVKPANMTTAARDEFIAFVLQAGEVNAATLPDLVDRAVALVIMREGASLVGTAAIKTPNVTYPPKVFRKAKVEDQAAAYPFELGWVHVQHAYERQGRGNALVAAAVDAAAGKGLYATTKSEAMRRMLPKLGFTALGTPYVSAEDPGTELTLFVRSSR